MAWQEQLRPGSFRGVAFDVREHEATLGRRTALHEYPGRDKPYVEDLGRRARALSVEAVLVGPGYMDARDALVRALEAPGPGKLVHPYLGELQVAVTEIKLRESTESGGMCCISIECVEAGAADFPTRSLDTGTGVRDAASGVQLAAAGQFARVRVAGQTATVTAPSAVRLTDMIGAVRRQLATAVPPADQAGEVAAALADLRVAASDPQAVYGLSDAGGAAAQMTAGCNLAGSLLPPSRAIDAGRELTALGVRATPGATATPSQVQATINANQLTLGTALLGLAMLASGTSALALTSRDEGLALRGEVVDAIDGLAEWPETSDESYAALARLRVAVVADIAARTELAPRVVQVELPTTTPALATTYMLYGDLANLDDLVQRNAVVHPLFVPGGRTLEVLARAA